MWLVVLVVAGLLATTADAGQAQTPSSVGDTSPSPGETRPSQGPVSIERIREGLRRAPDEPRLLGLDRQADFRIEILEKAKFDAILKKLDFTGGPVPGGGLYGYEQQQRLFRPSDHPLMQPYAAFSGGELVTIAIQNVIARLLGKPLVKAVTEASHAQAQRAAREEVDGKIAEFCASRPDRWDILLCNPVR